MTNRAQPIKCEAEYVVWENNKENGVFTANDEEICGYRIWENKSSVTLVWNLPDSEQDALDVLERPSWSDSEISYDDMDGLDSSRGMGSSDFDENGKELEEIEDFEGDGEEELDSFGSSYGPSSVRIHYDDKHSVSFERKEGAMSLLLPEEDSRSFTDQKEFIDELKKRILSR
jgi:hypothetical protein